MLIPPPLIRFRHHERMRGIGFIRVLGQAHFAGDSVGDMLPAVEDRFEAFGLLGGVGEEAVEGFAVGAAGLAAAFRGKFPVGWAGGFAADEASDVCGEDALEEQTIRVRVVGGNAVGELAEMAECF